MKGYICFECGIKICVKIPKKCYKHEAHPPTLSHQKKDRRWPNNYRSTTAETEEQPCLTQTDREYIGQTVHRIHKLKCVFQGCKHSNVSDFLVKLMVNLLENCDKEISFTILTSNCSSNFVFCMVLSYWHISDNISGYSSAIINVSPLIRASSRQSYTNTYWS